MTGPKMTGPFGALRPSPFQDRMRAIGARLPKNYFGRKAASLLLGPAGGRTRRAFDVDIFGNQRARLHPYDNICEKRVFVTPQLWEAEERQYLGDYISTFRGREFHFVDIGANVGLYTLFARAEARRAGAAFRAACIEADPEMAARLRFNIEASSAAAEVAIFNCAASDAEGDIGFSIDRKSRGLSRVDEKGAARVPARPICAMLKDASVGRIDALKIDIEGHEAPALAGFFRDAPDALHPGLIIIETSHDGDNAALKILAGAGYRKRHSTARNAILVKSA